MGIKSVTLGKACRIKVKERKLLRPGNFIRERAYPVKDETATTIRVMIRDIRRVFRVTAQILGYWGPNGDSHKKLQLFRVHPSDFNPSTLVEKLVISNHRKPRIMRVLGTIRTR
jgi:hypothetical protein